MIADNSDYAVPLCMDLLGKTNQIMNMKSDSERALQYSTFDKLSKVGKAGRPRKR